ncbi:Tyrosyl-DNA phosphodiesterase [Entamoeba marina]
MIKTPLYYFNNTPLSQTSLIEKNTVSFKQLFDTPGEIYAAVMTTYVFDINWIFTTIPKLKDIPVHFIHHGEFSFSDSMYIKTLSSFVSTKPNITTKFGCHHTKIIILLYEGGMRFVLSTANLCEMDYIYKSQGIYYKDFLPLQQTDKQKTPRATHFLTSLTSYFKAVGVDVPYLNDFDYSSVDGWLLVSIPGNYTTKAAEKVGIIQLQTILKQLNNKITGKCVIRAQVSSLGKLFPPFVSTFKKSIATSNADLQVIWPTEDFVRISESGYLGGSSLCLSQQNLKLVEPFFHTYISKPPRHLLQPHIKTYIVEVNKQIKYGILTSSNLSGSAWGYYSKNLLTINNYEMGMLFYEDFKEKIFPLPYDRDLSIKYKAKDNPWVFDVNHLVQDCNDCIIENGKYKKYQPGKTQHKWMNEKKNEQ